MPEQSNEIGEEEKAGDIDNNKVDANTEAKETEYEVASRKKKRKTAKKEKRKKKRKVMAEMARREEEARLDDPEEQLRLQDKEEQEKARAEKDRRELEERERKILEEWERRRAEDQREEEERRRRAHGEVYQIKQKHIGYANESDEDGWEYVQEGSPEIIWQENEIIVKKKKIRVKKKDADHQNTKEDPSRPTSNPLPPQSLVFADYDTSVLSAQQLLENVAQETPNFGTEQDKAHCPFHLKTGACRFGQYCSRIHFYPDKSCTLLIKNMYNGPGLAWEQDEGLEIVMDDHQRPDGIPVTRFTLHSIYASNDNEKLQFEYESGNTTIVVSGREVNDYASQPDISRQVDIFIRKMNSIPAFIANLTVESFNKRTLS
ncbi:hypothetical protein OROGR_009559 [Orobanche gracilis]